MIEAGAANTVFTRRSLKAWRMAMRAWAVAAVAVLCAFAASGASAQAPATFSSSYITPFPETDRYQAYVIGDWLAIGLASGLEEAMKQEGTIQILSNTKSSSGLTRQYDWVAEAERMVKAGPVHIVIVMMGVNDARTIRVGNDRVRPGTPEWREAYAKEAEKLIKAFRSAGVAVYWVGLPAMSNSTFSSTVETMNDAVRQATYLNGAKFIDTWTGFTDQSGAYSAFGADLTGQTKRLREGDGVSFTAAGNRKLAYYVEIALKRDLALARQQRNIPLAGDDEEQSRVVPRVAKAGRPAGDGPAEGLDGDGPAPGEAGPDALASEGVPARRDGSDGSAPLAQQATLQPASPPAGRQDQAAFATALAPQDVILGDLESGLTSMAVISPLNDLSFRDSQRRIPLSERLYFKVLSKGEALPPKEGRADDFAWENGQTAQ